MHLISLDKKRLVSDYVLTKHKLEELKLQYKLTKEVVQQQIQHDLYLKFMEGVQKELLTTVIPNIENGDELYRVEGYVISHLTLLELLQEIIDMDDIGRNILRNKVNDAITYRDKNVK